VSESSGESEQILWSDSVSHWHYAGKWLIVSVFAAALVATFFLRLAVDVTTILVVRVVLGVIAFVLVGWIRLDRSSRKYTITNRRVIAEFGIVSKRSNELPIQDIGHISLTVTGLWDLVGIGKLEFASAGAVKADVIFWNIHGAEKLLALVRSLRSSAA
jgi:uncharacterized membrane protein YdbT with pleckstrin-like domain